MRIEKTDLWAPGWDLRCITTNGTINRFGHAVMGRGCALEANKRYKRLSKFLADRIERFGNRVHLFADIDSTDLVTFPVKHNWWETADLELIERSAVQLDILVNEYNYTRIALPMPGCGNGNLSWEEVLPVIGWLDDRFTLVCL